MHRCVGAPLGRMELRASLRGLVRRFPGLQITASTGELAFRELSVVHGLDGLPARLW